MLTKITESRDNTQGNFSIESKTVAGNKATKSKANRHRGICRANSRSRAGVEEENLLLVARAHGHGGRDQKKDSPCRWCTESGPLLVYRYPYPGRRYLQFFLHRERELRC